jgi:hypothetical protein
VLAVPFVQPALGQTGRVRGFLLLVFHTDPSVSVRMDGGEAIRTEVVARLVRRFFEVAEGAWPPYDPELAGLLELIESYVRWRYFRSASAVACRRSSRPLAAPGRVIRAELPARFHGYARLAPKGVPHGNTPFGQ